MNVRQLSAHLEAADPEDLVVVDADSHSLFLMGRKSGTYQPLDGLTEDVSLTERDEALLCALRVRL